jgi:tetratricopeptide (TPR) repeat protein
VYLLSRLLWINRLSIDPGLGQHVPGPLLVAAGCAALAVLSLVALHQRRARPLVTFGIGWFFLQVLIPYTLLPRLDVINERHLYLANAGIFAGVGSIWAELSSRAKWSMWQSAGVAIAGLLAIGTVQRNLNYRSRIALWESTTRVSPSNPRAYNNLGVAYESAGRHAEARAAYAHALALRPEYDVARTNLRRVELLLAAR